MATATHRRVGLLIPSSNTMIEQEFPFALPRGLSAHFGRVEMTTLDDAGLRAQDVDLVRQAQLLGTAKIDAVLFCQSVYGFHRGRDHDQAMAERLAAAAGCPAVTAAGAMVEAASALGVRRLAFVTPFGPALNESVRRYFAERGFETVAMGGFTFSDNFAIAQVRPDDLVAAIRQGDTREAEAIVVPGGNLPCLGVIEAVEAALGKPMICTNQASIHAVLRRIGWDGPAPTGMGRLFAMDRRTA